VGTLSLYKELKFVPDSGSFTPPPLPSSKVFLDEQPPDFRPLSWPFFLRCLLRSFPRFMCNDTRESLHHARIASLPPPFLLGEKPPPKLMGCPPFPHFPYLVLCTFLSYFPTYVVFPCPPSSLAGPSPRESPQSPGHQIICFHASAASFQKLS